MSLVVRAFPLRGTRAQLEAFAAALHGERSAEAAQFYRHYGVTYESWHFQDTTNGPWVIAVSQIQDPDEAGARYAQATADFHAWFKTQVLSLTGIDPNTTPLGPPTQQVFSWSDGERQPIQFERSEP